jgi:hypothetical protein
MDVNKRIFKFREPALHLKRGGKVPCGFCWFFFSVVEVDCT